MFSAMAGIRGLLILQSGTSGGEVWLGGAALLLACVIALRRWAQYFLTSRRVIVKNGYTGFEIQALPLDQIAGILIEQGPVARILNIGTVVLRTYTGDESITLRGVSEPEILRTRVDALTTHRADHRTGISSPPL
jgi:membrane protein YdbS with pleckstrin-like domain